jgi:arylformamidase
VSERAETPARGREPDESSEEWIDISMPLTDGMIHWPGDPVPRIRRTLDMENGDPLNLTHLDICAHTGTHIDAPRHFRKDGSGIDRMPLSAGIGPARVVGIRDPETIRPAELAAHDIGPGERILFRTANSDGPRAGSAFRERFVHLSVEAARFLAERGVRLAGVDALSVDAFAAADAPVHRILLSAGIWIVEGLDLSRIVPGRYELICLPLKIMEGDGAPARAALRPLDARS